MAQAQISTQIGTFLVERNFTITSDMGITKIIVNSVSRVAEATIQGTLNLGGQISQPIVLSTSQTTIDGGGQPLNGIILSGAIQVIAFQ